MAPRDAKAEMREARKVLEDLYMEQDELQVRIAKQKRIIAALTELADVEEDSPPPSDLVKGITDACKTAVLGSNKPLYPSEIRDRIQALGFPEQKNLLASVHTIVKRLAEAGEVMEVDGAYRRLTFGEKITARAMSDSGKEIAERQFKMVPNPVNLNVRGIPLAPKPPGWDKKK
jgi:hypothetical protein